MELNTTIDRRPVFETYAEKFPLNFTGPEGNFRVTCLAIQDVSVSAPTIQEGLSAVRQEIAKRLMELVDAGQVPPLPTEGQPLAAQVNVRFTSHERATIEAAQKRMNYPSLSEYIRDAARARVFENETGLKLERRPLERKSS